MGAVRADCEQKLEQEFVARLAEREFRAPVLTAHQAELRRLVSDQQRLTRITQRRGIRAVGAVVTRAGKPAAPDLVVARHVKADGLLQSVWLIPAAPDHFPAAEERVVDGPPQRLPSNRR